MKVGRLPCYCVSICKKKKTKLKDASPKGKKGKLGPRPHTSCYIPSQLKSNYFSIWKKFVMIQARYDQPIRVSGHYSVNMQRHSRIRIEESALVLLLELHASGNSLRENKTKVKDEISCATEVKEL